MTKQIDARVIKSKTKLKEALLELMKDRKFEKINVCEICEHAGIHRMTFYNHYADKYALFDEAIQDIKDNIHDRYTKQIHLNSSISYTEQVIRLFEVLINELSVYRPIFKSIIGSDDYYELFSLIHKTFEEGLTDVSYRIFIIKNTLYFNLLPVKSCKESNTYLDLKIKFFIGGVGHLITYYMYNKEEINFQEFKDCIRKIIDIFYNKD